MFFIIFILFNALFPLDPAVIARSVDKTLIVVKKSEFKLYVLDKKMNIIASFSAGTGKNTTEQDKLHEGDNRTPVGYYKIARVYSCRQSKKSSSCRNLKKLNSLFLKKEDGFYFYRENTKSLGIHAYGTGYYELDYPNSEDLNRHENMLAAGKIPDNKDGVPAGPGSGIAIHGTNDPAGVGQPSSAGCIVLKNRDIVKLEKFLKKGTTVVILP